MTVKDRLSEFIEHLGTTAAAFEKKCGMSNGSINNIRSSIGSKNLDKITKTFPELNKIWLLHGEGDMLTVRKSDHAEVKSDNSQMISITEWNKIADSNKILADAYKADAEARLIDAKARLELVGSNSMLTAVLDRLIPAAIEPSVTDMLQVLKAGQVGLLDALADIASGKKYSSKDEAVQAIGKKIHAGNPRAKAAGKSSVVGR